MNCAVENDFCVQAGETWHPTIRWGTGTLTSKAISAIAKTTPVQITATAHGVPNGWPVAVVGVEGMIQINAVRYPPQGNDWHYATVPDANTVLLNDVSADSFSTYDEGGHLVYDTPKDLTGCTFALTVYDNPEHSGTPLSTLTSTGGQITVDDVLKTITPLLQTAGATWTAGYYKLLATEASGVVTELMRGVINIE